MVMWGVGPGQGPPSHSFEVDGFVVPGASELFVPSVVFWAGAADGAGLVAAGEPVTRVAAEGAVRRTG